MNNLPNYFLADLGPEATISSVMLREACETLKQNRKLYLMQRSTAGLIDLLCGVAREWLQPNYPLRTLALEQGPAATGFSKATLENGLNGFFQHFTPENFLALIEQDLGHLQRLDKMVSTDLEQKHRRAAVAMAPEFLAHVAAGNLPPPTLMSITLGVLVRSAQLVKCSRRGSFLPRLFAHSLYEADRKLGACLELAVWPGGSDLDECLFSQADCVTATGSDEALAAIRNKIPKSARFLGYGHRVSFGFIAGDVLTGLNARRIAHCAATDVIAWNQLGCLSPHVFYIEDGGVLSPEQFAGILAEELEQKERSEPRGELPMEIAAAIASRRSIYEVRAAHTPETQMWRSQQSTAWTVVFESDPRFQVSCLHRFVYVKSVKNLTEALQAADAVRGKVSTVGLAAPGHKAQDLATELARWGVTRVCPLGQMQNPPLTWRHDGRPSLGDLVIWADWEQ